MGKPNVEMAEIVKVGLRGWNRKDMNVFSVGYLRRAAEGQNLRLPILLG